MSEPAGKLRFWQAAGGSGIGKTAKKLMPYVGTADIVDARIVSPGAGEDEMKAWALEAMK